MELKGDPQDLGFIVLCLRIPSPELRSFILTIYSSTDLGKLCPTEDAFDLGFKDSIQGFWASDSSGGSLNSLAFTNNLQYILESEDDTETFIRLSANSDILISLYLYEYNGRDLSLFSTEELFNGIVALFTSHSKTSSIYLSLRKEKKYLLIPCQNDYSKVYVV